MKKIDYSIRSFFYDFEVKRDRKIVKFLEKIPMKYCIKSTINCPCASGIYLNEFSVNYSKSIFVDINKEMIDKVSKKIHDNNISNIEILKSDIRDICELKDNVDCIMMLNQGLQYISVSDFEKTLKNLNVNYLILDLFDFNKNGKTQYFNKNKKDKYYLSKKFLIGNKIVKRYNKWFKNGDKIYFDYAYYINNRKEYETHFELYNYVLDDVYKIIRKSNYKLVNIYGTYSFKKYSPNKGHYILVLKRCDCEV